MKKKCLTREQVVYPRALESADLVGADDLHSGGVRERGVALAVRLFGHGELEGRGRKRVPPSLYLRSRNQSPPLSRRADAESRFDLLGRLCVRVRAPREHCTRERNTREPVRCSERQSAAVAATVGQRTGGTPRLAHPRLKQGRPPRTQPVVAKARTHAANRERVISVGAARPGRSL